MSEHTVKAFDAELQELRRQIAVMGGLAGKQISDAIGALTSRDFAIAREIVAADAAIDRMQTEIEEKAILTIARRQPMAVDLREIVGALRVVTGLERIGDYAKNIAKRVIATGADAGPPAAVESLKDMAGLVIAALKQVLDAYAKRDLEKALAVWRGDTAIDAAYNALLGQLLTFMTADPSSIRACANLMFCAKNIERMGDHATNIAETVYYIVHGTPLEGERPKAAP